MSSLTVLSLGGGWQSSALLLMSCTGVLPKIDAAVFADTGGEMPETYEYLDYLQTQTDKAGIKLIYATAGNLAAEVTARRGKGSQPSLPVRVRDENDQLQRVNGYTCSYDFKRRVVTREVRRLCGGRGAWKNATVTQLIGYTLDEISRMKQDSECRCGHKRPASTSSRSGRVMGHDAGGACRECDCRKFDPWRQNAWPLITDMQMTRADTRRWIIDNGYPEPPRSACFFCPNRGNSHWRYLRDERPELWGEAVALDETIRHGLNGLRGAAFLHQSGVALANADLRPRYEQLRDEGIEPLFTNEADTDCDAGVCFT